MPAYAQPSPVPQSTAAAEPPGPARLRMSTLSQVQPAPVRWLWDQRIPCGKLTILAGDPGSGKSLLSLYLAARLSAGRPWPDGAEAPQPADVILLSAGDSLPDTIRPRLDALEADLSRVHALDICVETPGGDVPLSIASHIRQLEDAILDCNASLLIIDPLLAFTPSAPSRLRASLDLLAGVAERTGCAILATLHLTRRSAAGSVLHRLAASPDVAAAASSVIVIGAHSRDPDHRVLAHVKSKLAPSPTSWASGSATTAAWSGQAPCPSARPSSSTPHRPHPQPTAR